MAYGPKLIDRDIAEKATSAAPTVQFARERLGQENVRLYDLVDRLRRAGHALRDRLTGPVPEPAVDGGRQKEIAAMLERASHAPLLEAVGLLQAGLGELEAALSLVESQI